MKTPKPPISLRQGDVLIKKIDSIPPDAKPVDWSKEGRVILAYGEVTNHCHQIALNYATMLQTEAGQRYLQIKEGAELTHEEHSVIRPEAGLYEVVIQREYSPEAIRNVAD